MIVKQENHAGADPTAQDKAQEKERENEHAAEEMRALEGGVAPTKLSDWPSGPAKYLTYGNDDDEVYGVGVTAKLGPANLERFGDGSVEIDGENVDNPDDYKGEPIAGGPTDTQVPS
jgi:hypothetical protein